MYVHPLFHDFCESIEIAKFKGAEIEFQIHKNSTSLKKQCWYIQLAKI